MASAEHVQKLLSELSPLEAEAKNMTFEAIGEQNKETQWWEHIVPLDRLQKEFGCNFQTGLTKAAAEKRLSDDGENKLTPPPEKSELRKFVEQMTGFFSLLLWFGSALSFFGYILDPSEPSNMYIGIVLAVVVFLTGCFSYLQERKSSDVMKQFSGMLPEDTTVIRDGVRSKIATTQLVVGDLVQVEQGDNACADLRVIESAGLKVDHSALTGEPDHLTRGNHGNHWDPKESANVCFFGSPLAQGTATCIVIKTGDRTYMGKIKSLAAGGDAEVSPINIEIHHFVKIVSSVAGFLGITFFLVGVFNGTPWISNLVFMIGIIVANVPEGLLATVTVSLSLTARRMFEENVMVRKLEAVETLGSTSCICSDKTGTLTKNVMTVVDVCVNNELGSTEEAGARPRVYDVKNPKGSFQILLRAICLATSATFLKADVDAGKGVFERKMVEGNASDHALVKFGEDCLIKQGKSPSNINIDAERAKYTKVAQIPFNSANKWELQIVRYDEGPYSHLVAVKGATDRILKWCDRMIVDGEEQQLTDPMKEQMLALMNESMNAGKRVLGFAQLLLKKKQRGVTRGVADGQVGVVVGEYKKCFGDFETADFFHLEEGDTPNITNARFDNSSFAFLGFCGLQDPPRSNVPQAVNACHTAGIKVIMVTGDHPGTARAIAQQVNIVKKGKTAEEIASVRLGKPEEKLTRDEIVQFQDEADARVIPGTEVVDLVAFNNENEWDRIMEKNQLVFARTSPEQKLIIVEQCQKRGHIVAVTGDGVNDSPALKKAHIGVAMGIAGTPVAKDVADMILMDDSFASIVMGVKEGRLIFDNLKKSIAYTLSSNIPEISPFLAFISFGLPLPLSTVLILCIDLGTDMLPAISLAYERPENNIMNRKPRTKNDNLVTSRLVSFSYLQIGVLQALAGFFTYLVVLGDYGFPPWVLPGAGLEWSTANDVLYAGQGWIARDEALKRAQTAFFVSIVIVQWADLLICKTRSLSLFYHGFHNTVLMVGLVEETLLCCVLCYTPYLGVVFGTRPIRFVHWLPSMPFSLLIFTYDETRKWLLRRSPTGFLHGKTYY